MKHIAALRAKEHGVEIEIRWCPSHQGIEGNEVADEWPNSPLTSQMPTVEWFASGTRVAKSGRESPPPRFLANVKRGFSEKKWAEAKGQEEAR